ncbi:hypothetical protein Dda3937_01196 [Dickeya dadantii 3937]|uniref:Uncharacterized protein n=1 Tax=Dickeya dadantii (strain 3937) TaxID=198628 RepID=E0SMM3_DICD3|nr:hypothetical protein Dda3937_01196 [Dickeya dadantii 3937]
MESRLNAGYLPFTGKSILDHNNQHLFYFLLKWNFYFIYSKAVSAICHPKPQQRCNHGNRIQFHSRRGGAQPQRARRAGVQPGHRRTDSSGGAEQRR